MWLFCSSRTGSMREAKLKKVGAVAIILSALSIRRIVFETRSSIAIQGSCSAKADRRSRMAAETARRPSLRAELLQVSIQLAHAQQFRRRRRQQEARETRQHQDHKSPVCRPPSDASFEPSQELEAGEPSKRRGCGDFREEHEQ